ncbi:hypothetical protein L7G72_14790 [Xenorhabdus bovienii]|uniref:hypothetical protein n=1 Tax=Xenorhabdus bovienii TaxID=40576 RepID=UPI001EDF7BD5|nr:hypothetical protein [Xenorhabdus bovienii]MCG3463086.1 hypothetical protein [Xenorhabdus bovienii]
MKETPIIFNTDMVRAILDGRKTQTRRVIQSPAKNMQYQGSEVIRHRALGNKWYGDYVFSMRDKHGTWQDYTHKQFIAKCPRGQIGDQLWVRETFAMGLCTKSGLAYRATHKPEDLDDGWWEKIKWTPSIHMPRWASRITLEVTDVRVERLGDISDDDAKAEGCWYGKGDNTVDPAVIPENHFPTLWAAIYSEESWNANPWVWVIEFRRINNDK